MKAFSLLLMMTVFMSAAFMDTAPTETAPDIIMENTKGETLKLSNVEAEYVLVDFWASWCKPCCKSRPNLKKVYDKYKDNTSNGVAQFEIFSVSLDRNKAQWTQGIRDYGLEWANHVSTLNGFKSPVVKQYGIKGIPNNVLLNAKGEIVKRNISFEDLDAFLAQN